MIKHGLEARATIVLSALSAHSAVKRFYLRLPSPRSLSSE